MLRNATLLAASLSAALVIACGLAFAGLGPASPPSPAVVVDPAAATDAPTAEPPVQVDTVYLTPKATPRSVTITKVRTASSHHGDGEHESEGGSD